MIRVIGIDPGIQTTGYGILEMARTVTYLDAGDIRPRRRRNFYQKGGEIFERLNEIIARHCPKSMAVETVYIDKNVQSAMKLGYARSAAILAGVKNRLDVYEYSPRAVKKAVVGYGAAEKQQLNYLIKQVLGVDLGWSEHATDALSVAFCHLSHMRWEEMTRPSKSTDLVDTP